MATSEPVPELLRSPWPGEWREALEVPEGSTPPPAASYLLNVVALVEVDLPDRDALRSELSGYLMELAEMEGVPLERRIDGSPAYRWFDRYWVDDDRIPFFIEVSGEIAGFCLVRVMDAGWSIAEFGIRREWRRKGHGPSLSRGSRVHRERCRSQASPRRRSELERGRVLFLDCVWV